MTRTTFSRTLARMTVVGICIAGLAGCYAKGEVTTQLPDADAINHVKLEKPHFVAYLSSVSVTVDKSPTNTSADFERRFLGGLQQSGALSDVIYGLYARKPEPPFVNLSLRVDEVNNVNTGANVAKAALIGGSFFLLGPVIPYTTDFHTTFTLQADWTDGTSREFKAECGGHSSATMAQGIQAAHNQASGGATSQCLNSVINQLTSDQHI